MGELWRILFVHWLCVVAENNLLNQFENRPRLFSKDGNLHIVSATGRNISFVISSGSEILLNGVPLSQMPTVVSK